MASVRNMPAPESEPSSPALAASQRSGFTPPALRAHASPPAGPYRVRTTSASDAPPAATSVVWVGASPRVADPVKAPATMEDPSGRAATSGVRTDVGMA